MTKEELEKLKQTVDYFGHWYDVIGEERIVILEKSIDYIDTLCKLHKAKELLRELYVKARYSPFAMEEHKNILTEVLEFLQEE